MKRLFVAATSILTLCMLGQPPMLHAQAKTQTKATKSKTMSASGVVKSVSATALTVSSGGKDMTFTIDNDTKFVGKGLSTKTAAKNGKLSATDAVGMNDRVTVSYNDISGKMHAATVTITTKATSKK